MIVFLFVFVACFFVWFFGCFFVCFVACLFACFVACFVACFCCVFVCFFVLPAFVLVGLLVLMVFFCLFTPSDGQSPRKPKFIVIYSVFEWRSSDNTVHGSVCTKGKSEHTVIYSVFG